jgi:hypothetical protein
MNDQAIFVDETGGNEALSEPGPAMGEDELARLFFQSSDFLGEITRVPPWVQPTTSVPLRSA